MPVRELRCRNCRAFITYERILAGYIVHQCSKCGFKNKFKFGFLNVPSVRNSLEKFKIDNLKGGENEQ